MTHWSQKASPVMWEVCWRGDNCQGPQSETDSWKTQSFVQLISGRKLQGKRSVSTRCGESEKQKEVWLASGKKMESKKKWVELKERLRLGSVQEGGRSVIRSQLQAANARERRSRLLLLCSCRGIFHLEAGQHRTKWPSKQQQFMGCWCRMYHGTTIRAIATKEKLQAVEGRRAKPQPWLPWGCPSEWNVWVLNVLILYLYAKSYE